MLFIRVILLLYHRLVHIKVIHTTARYQYCFNSQRSIEYIHYKVKHYTMPKIKKENISVRENKVKEEIVVIDTYIEPLKAKIEYFSALPAIKNKIDMVNASETLSRINSIADELDVDKKKLTEPANRLIAEIRSRYKPAESYLKPLIEMLRDKIGRYQTEALRIEAMEKAKIADRVGEGKGHLSVETASRRIEKIETPDSAVETGSGTVKFREDKILNIVDRTVIPGIYWDINEKRLLDDLKAGKLVPGAEIEIVMKPINYRG